MRFCSYFDWFQAICQECSKLPFSNYTNKISGQKVMRLCLHNNCFANNRNILYNAH